MTMLMHTRGPLERDASSVVRRDAASDEAAKARLALIKRVCIGALTVLAATGALAAIIALKAAIYYWRFLH
jgi:anti-sigma factor RsiW